MYRLSKIILKQIYISRIMDINKVSVAGVATLFDDREARSATR